MIKRIANFCVREPFIIGLLMVVLLGGGWYAKEKVPIDAIPNIGQNQVIVLTEWMGRSPKDVEDQITYPLSISLLSVPGAESVRGKSLFGYSFVQVTFKDDIDFYWARSRVSEQLTTVASKLPEGVAPQLGPDATGLGQIFYYVLVPDKPTNLAELRSVQDYVVKYALQSVEGVSEVASVGGYVRQYQIDVDPDRLRFHNIPLSKLVMALKEANTEVGAKTVEQSGMEFIIRGKGYLGGGQGRHQALTDMGNAVVTSHTGVPVRVSDLGHVQSGTDFRRGAIDLNGGEAVGGIVVMRFGENPLKIIAAVKEKIAQIEPSLHGIKIQGIYDRTNLIEETIETLTNALRDEIVITIVVIVLFLLHIRSSLIVAAALPTAVLLAFVAMRTFGLDANIMSLAGIAIAIGNMVDMGIVICENIYEQLAALYEKHTGRELPPGSRLETIIDAVAEVAPALMTATSTTVISFLPVFFLTGRDYKLFAPLAWTKTYALLASLICAIVFIPFLCRLFLKPAPIKGNRPSMYGVVGAILSGAIVWFVWPMDQIALRILITVIGAVCGFAGGYFVAKETLRPIENNPVSRRIFSIYEPLLRWVLAHRKPFLVIPVMIFGLGLFAWSTLKSDDWIALDEGGFFYMPTLYPSASFSKALEVLQTQDTLIKDIPEVDNVLGKIGRAESALDPAPAAMVETYVTLKPKSAWRPGIKEQDIWAEINKRATLPGVTPASYLQPIEGRVIMLQSGIKAPMAIRVYGDSLQGLADAAKHVAAYMKTLPAVNGDTVNPDIVLGKPYAEFEVNREAAARYGLSVKDINDIVEIAVGGKVVTQTIEGRERYPVRVRYLRELRDRVENLDQLPVVTPSGEVIPLGVLAEMKTTWGPAAISSEDARLVAHVSFSPSGTMGDLETVKNVTDSLAAAQNQGKLALPPGYELQAVGSFQNQIEANQRLMFLVPLVILCNLFIIFLQFRKASVSLLVFTGIPVGFGGGMILLALLGVEINTAIWVGFIALFGISVDNGVILSTYLESFFRKNPVASKQEMIDGVVVACMRRVRPCLMTTTTTLIALLPVILSSGRGADVARAMALPIFGGMMIALLELFVVPVLYSFIRERELSATAQVAA